MKIEDERRGALRRLDPDDTSICAGWCWHPRGMPFRYAVVAPYELELSGDDAKKRVTVRRGFLTDGATCGPDLGAAYVYHDHLYCTHAFDGGVPCTRQEADEVMRKVLRRDGLYVYANVFRLLAWLNPGWAFSKAWNANGACGPQYDQDG